MTCVRLSKSKVFSTYVEVFLTIKEQFYDRTSLLHVRGGVSKTDTSDFIRITSSPRTWRCFI